MKAVMYHEYGSPDVLKLVEIAKPTPKADELLIHMRAASINSWDWDRLRGDFLNRLAGGGWQKPKLPILGCDVAGEVEAVGANVKQFQPGDRVLGDISEHGWGAFAEYVAVRENSMTLQPVAMTFEQAAAIPQAALLALQGLRDVGQIQAGQSVLINGAGGGVGTFAIQLAKYFGAEVTGVDSTRKLEMMRRLGADHVIDYTRADFTQQGQRYDLILDVVARRPISAYRRVLSPTGILAVVGGSISTIFQTAMVGTWFSQTGSQKMGVVFHKPNKDMALILELFAAGHVRPVLDRSYPLAATADAFRYFEQGHAIGKVIITVEQTNDR